MSKNSRTKLAEESRYNWRIIVLLILSFLLYANSITSNYNLDDELVTNGHPLTSQGIKAIPDIFRSYYFDNGQGITYGYRPVTLTSFALENQVFGDNPFVSHLINVILYSILVVLLYVFLSRLFADKKYLHLAFAIGILFSCHPLHTEVVASIKNREEILSLLFVILASISAIGFQDKEKKYFLLFTVLFSVLAILSKKSAIPGIIMIPVFLILFRPVKLSKLIPLTVVLLIMLFITVPIKDLTNNMLFVSALSVFYTLLFWGKKEFRLNQVRNPLLDLSVVILGILFIYALITSSQLAFLITILGSLILLAFQKHYRIPAYIFAFISIAILARSFIYAGESKVFILLGLVSLALYAKNDSQKYMRILVLILTFVLSAVYILNAPQFFNVLLLVLILLSLVIAFWESPRILSYSVATIIALLAIYTIVWAGFDMMIFVYFLTITFLIGGSIKFRLSLDKQKWIVLPLFLTLIYFSSNKYSNEWDWKYQDLGEVKVENTKSVVRDIGRVLEPSESVFVGDINNSERLATSFFILGKYLQLHVFPHPLRFYYGYAQVEKHDFRELEVWLWLIIYLSLFFSSIYYLSRHPIYSLGVLLFLVSLAPFSNLFIPMAGMMGERLAFSASLGFSIVLGYTIHLLFRNRIGEINYRYWLLVIVLFSAFSLKTISRNKNWNDKFTLYTHDIQYSSESAKMNQLVGSMYFELSKEKNLAEYARKAIPYFEKANSIYPDNFMYWFSLALTYQYLGDYQSAIPGFINSINLNPTFTDTYFNLAICAQSVGDYTTAIDNYEKYITLEPENENVYANLSFLYFQIGELSKSVGVNENAINRFPTSPIGYINLGKTYLMAGDTTNAVLNLEKGASLDPGNKSLFGNLSNLFLKMNDLEKADYYRQKASN